MSTASIPSTAPAMVSERRARRVAFAAIGVAAPVLLGHDEVRVR
jgi:hypothetical protein